MEVEVEVEFQYEAIFELVACNLEGVHDRLDQRTSFLNFGRWDVHKRGHGLHHEVHATPCHLELE